MEKIKIDKDRVNIAKLTTTDSITLSDYIIKSDSYYDLILNRSLKEINEKNIIGKTSELYRIKKDSINNLVLRYCTDSLLARWYFKEQMFWEHRNNYMVREIKTIASKYPGKKIIVLTGLNHKYFLLKELGEYDNSYFTLINFPEEL